MKTASKFLLLGLVLAGGPVNADDKWDISKLDSSKLPTAADNKGLTYAKDIRPLFEASCFRCHGEERPKGDLRLDSLEAVLKGGEDGKVLVPGNSKKSPLVFAVARIDDEIAMPPKRRGGPGGGPGGPGGFGGPGGPGGRGGFGPGMMLASQMLSQADKNGDQKLTQDEFTALADAWFDKLDADKAGKLTQEQFNERFGEVLPPPQGFGPPGGGGPGGGPGEGGPPGGGGRGFGPGRFMGRGLFTAADSDKDGSLTRAEFKGTFAKWFGDWDSDKSGSLDENELRMGLNAALPRPNFGGRGGRGGPGGPGGPDGPGGQFGGGPGGPDSGRPPGGPGGGNPPPDGPGGPGGGPGGQGGPGGRGGPGGFGPPATPLTAEQVGLVRAWIDQGAK